MNFHAAAPNPNSLKHRVYFAGFAHLTFSDTVFVEFFSGASLYDGGLTIDGTIS